MVRFSLQTQAELVVDTVDNKQTVMKANIIKACDSEYKYPLNPHKLSEESRLEALWMNVTHTEYKGALCTLEILSYLLHNNEFFGCQIGGHNQVDINHRKNIFNFN